MKNVLLILLVLLPVLTDARKRPTRADRRKHVVINYDFNKQRFDSDRPNPWIHQPVSLKIYNINRLAYDITISSRDSVLAENEAITGTTTAAGKEESFEEEKKSADALIAAAQAVSASAQKLRLAESIKEAPVGQTSKEKAEISSATAVVKQIESLQRQKAGAEHALLAATNTNDSTIQITKLHTIKAATDAKEAELDATQAKIAERTAQRAVAMQYAKVREEGLKLGFDQFLERYAMLQPIYQCYYNLLRVAGMPNTSKASFLGDAELQAMLTEHKPEGQYKTLDAVFKTAAAFNRAADAYDAWLLQEKHLNDDDKNAYKIMSRACGNEVSRLTSRVTRRNVNVLIDSSVSLRTRLLDTLNYEYTSPPIQPSADIVVFDVRINNERLSYPNDARSFSYRDFVRGGLRYDVSTGLVFNVGIADRKYRLETEGEGDQARVRIYENGQENQFTPQIAAMFHASIRSRNCVNMAFTLGASINTEKLDIGSIFPGLSVTVGHRNKFMFTAGPSLKKVEVLRSKYDQNSTFGVGTLQEDDLTEAVYRVGAFIGISYNLTSAQKSNIKL